MTKIISQIQNRLFIRLLLILLVPGLFSCHSSQNKGKDNNEIALIQLPDPKPIPKAEQERIYNASKKWYDSILAATGFNGGIIVAKDGNIIFESYKGTSHIPGRDTINENTPMHIASVSKTFTATAILKLWQDGKLKIDDTISKYLPEFSYPGITIRMLLNHRSGLPNYVHYFETLNLDKSRMITNQDVLQSLINKQYNIPPTNTPDTRFAYCNTNYALLALIVEKVTGETLSTYLRNTFFLPLQMKNTFIFNPADSLKVAPSYDWRQRLIPMNYLDGVYGDKNIYTTPRDLLVWDRALSCGKILNPDILKQAYTPYSNEKPGVKNYGLGWRMNIYPNGKKMIYHNGWWHGSNAAFIRLLDESATIIVIGNKYNRGVYHAKDLAGIFSASYTGGIDEEENENQRPPDESEVSGVAPDSIGVNKPLNYRDSLLNEMLQPHKLPAKKRRR